MHFLQKNISFLSKKNIAFNPSENTPKRVIQKINEGINPSIDELILIADYYDYSIDRLVKTDIENHLEQLHAKKYKFLALDVDGVLTDGSMFFSNQSIELKAFNSKDGLGLKKLVDSGFQVGFITSGVNTELIQRRANALGVQHISVGNWNKLDQVKEWCRTCQISMDEVVYIGDDMNDIEAIKAVGLGACPADAMPKVKEAADVVLQSLGGKGAVRECIEQFILEMN